MTRLFNLQSYVECCQYSQLFKESTKQLIPRSTDLPSAYKAFIQKYADHLYLPQPVWGSNRSQDLKINQGSLNYLSIGTLLTQEDKQWLFIIRDTVDLMTLSMSNLLDYRDGYLYSSAYHYWNYYSQISRHEITKPLVFIDLDSFGYNCLIPINLSQRDNSPYRIPILNTKEPITLDLDYNSIETYNNICQSTAAQILNDNFPAFAQNVDTVNHLASYLQKTCFFQGIQSYIHQKSFDYIIEILHNQQIFYKKVTLSIDAIAQIVSTRINSQYLHNLASKYPHYQFALVSQYNIFSNIEKVLPKFICLNPIRQDFNRIWQEKKQLNFPLFGIYLDQIEFAIGISNEQRRPLQQWIQLSDQKNFISYEGNPTVLIGRLPSSNQDFFRIPRGNRIANLPIKVNDKEYCINGIPQNYRIEIENYEGTEELCVRLEFHLQPGSCPKLKVTDLQDRYKLTASLIYREPTSYSYIPPKEIISTRQKDSLAQINRLQECLELENLKTQLSQISEELEKISDKENEPINYTILRDLFKDISQRINSNKNLLQFIDSSSDEPLVSQLRTELQKPSIQKIVESICLSLNSYSYNSSNLVKKDFLVKAIIFIGKTYHFSQYLLADSLFDLKSRIFEQTRHRDLVNEYFQCLARIAIKKELQSKYFNWFESQYKLETSKYLWGYGRILLWYYNFESAEHVVNYRANFIAIMEYLLTKNYSNFNNQYKQNAFLSLLYLLTFRANDEVFCQQGSQEMQMAERVINHFKDDRIILNQVSKEKPLNHFLREMIEGSATENDVASLLQG